MNISRTQYDSIETDRGLRDVSLVLHGNSSQADSDRILQDGMMADEGRAVVSTDLAHAVDWATSSEKRNWSKSLSERSVNETGMAFVFQIQPELHVGYGMFTSMSVDERKMEVTDAPIKYASGRKQLAIYTSSDTELARKRFEADHKSGVKHNKIRLGRESIALGIHPTPEIIHCVADIQEQARRFEKPDIGSTSGKLVSLLLADRCHYVARGKDMSRIVREVLEETIVSICISRVRNLGLDVKRVLGYKIIREDGVSDRQVGFPVVKDRVDQFFLKTHAQGFDVGKVWLNEYLRSESERLAVELSCMESKRR